MQKHERQFLYVNPEKCVGCSLCEYACSLKKVNELNPQKSRIRVSRAHPFIHVASTCILCDDPPCITSCPRKCLSQSSATGVIIVDKEKCNGCGWCIEACPYGAVQYDEGIGAVAICDLCDGKPECIDFCPTEAIEFLKSDEDIKGKWTLARKSWVEESKKLLQMESGEKTDIFANYSENAQKIEEKLQLLYEKKHKLTKR